MPKSPLLQAWVHSLRHEADDTISIDLRPLGTGEFPAFEAGAHIDLHLPNGLTRSYSLCNNAQERHRYVVAVLKDRASRGGSRCVHEQLRVHLPITLSAPRNHFALQAGASHTVLVAGGIGVTPLLCMAQHLKDSGQGFEFVYLARSRASAAFVADIAALGVPVTWHFDDEQGGPPNLAALLARRAASATEHYYACGPARMLDQFEATCTALGHANAHIERFSAVALASAPEAQKTYTVELRRSGKTFDVTPDTSLHQRLLDLQVKVPFSCEAGLCGACETRVLEGEVAHRDSVLTASERASHRVMLVCVSGCKSARLVLDL